jgi:1-acyl-sn-glycerol-3-phosphate acyltransferase
MGVEYAKHGELYNINHSVKKIEKLFAAAIKDSRTQKMIRENKAVKKYNDRVLRGNHVKEFFARIFYSGIVIPLLVLIDGCLFGLKIKNRKLLKKIRGTGAVAICNHIHEMDCTMCAVAFGIRKLLFVSQPSNFSLAVAGFFVDILGSVPTPSTPKEIQSFMYTLSKHLRKRQAVLFYPEGERQNYAEGLREFQRGPFYLAIDAQVPVLPMKIVYRDPDGLLKFFKKKPCLTLIIGEPLYPNSLLLNNDAEADLKKRAETVMQDLTG